MKLYKINSQITDSGVFLNKTLNIIFLRKNILHYFDTEDNII